MKPNERTNGESEVTRLEEIKNILEGFTGYEETSLRKIDILWLIEKLEKAIEILKVKNVVEEVYEGEENPIITQFLKELE